MASLPRLPKVENTIGVKEVDPTLQTWSPYSCFFSQVNVYRTNTLLSPVIARCIGMKQPNIKNAPCHLPQNLLAWISALASSLQLADVGTRNKQDSTSDNELYTFIKVY